jgi:hypothetical protein
VENLSLYFFIYSVGFFSSALAFYMFEYGRGFGRRDLKKDIADDVARFTEEAYKNPDHLANLHGVISEGTRLALERAEHEERPPLNAKRD